MCLFYEICEKGSRSAGAECDSNAFRTTSTKPKLRLRLERLARYVCWLLLFEVPLKELPIAQIVRLRMTHSLANNELERI